jgi:mRNA-decapping enzyme subunit 2
VCACSRFIINLPEEELHSFERICFQIEAAHWFYEDFYREHDPKLPPASLKLFARQSACSPRIPLPAPL